MFYCKKVIMKCPGYKEEKMEKTSAAVATANSKAPLLKAPPVNPAPSPIKPMCPPAGATTVLFSLNNSTSIVHNKENSTSRDHGTMDKGFEDSGYLSLQNSHIDDHHGNEEDDHIQGKITATTHQGKNISKKSSPSKCQGKMNSSAMPLLAASPPVGCHSRRTATSTPSDHLNTNLPILKFQEAVCDELAKSYRKNKR